MDNEIIDNSMNNNLVINDEIRSFLHEIAKWSKFLSIVGFIMIAFMILAGVLMGTFMGSMMGQDMPNSGFPSFIGGSFFMFLYIIMAAIYFFPVLYLYKFSNNLKLALNSDGQEFLNESFLNLKKHYKYIGILMVVVLAFYALMIVFGLIGGAGMLFK
jgi:hypothetical protein